MDKKTKKKKWNFEREWAEKKDFKDRPFGEQNRENL